jgi:hypothetical protein
MESRTPSMMKISDEEVARRNRNFTGHRDDEWVCPNCMRPHPGYHYQCSYCNSGVKRVQPGN